MTRNSRRTLAEIQRAHQQAAADRAEMIRRVSPTTSPAADHDHDEHQADDEHQDDDPVTLAACWLAAWMGGRTRAWTNDAQQAFVSAHGPVSAAGWALVVERAGLVERESSPGAAWTFLESPGAPELRPAIGAHKSRTYPST